MPHAATRPKKLRGIQRSADRHWVGDGFPVRTLLAYPRLGPVISPFLLLGYAGPMEFPPTSERRGGLFERRGYSTSAFAACRATDTVFTLTNSRSPHGPSSRP